MQRVAHAGIRHQAADAFCEAGIGQHVTEGTGFFIFAGGNDDDVTRLGIVDGKLQHDVVARRAFDREGRAAEFHAIIDRLQPRGQCAATSLRLMDRGGREFGKRFDIRLGRTLRDIFNVDHENLPR